MTLKLMPSSPAPVSRTKADAIWTTMKAWRTRCAVRLALAARDSAFKA